MQDELVEAVARAAYIAHHKNGPLEENALSEPNMGRGGFKTEVCVWNAVARAAIAAVVEALQEPSEAMIKAGWDDSSSDWPGMPQDVVPVWQAMLSAFLQHGEK